MKYKIRWFISDIRDFFKPKQKWLTKKIPRHWTDKQVLIEIALFESLIHYVEEEKGLQDDVDWTEDLIKGFVTKEYVQSVVTTSKRLRNAYEYIKYERPLLQKQLDRIYPDFDAKGSYEDLYSETDRIESLITQKDTDAMQVIIELRQYMWT